jgi:hypothetical protein
MEKAKMWTRTLCLLVALGLSGSALLAGDSPGTNASEKPAVAKTKQLIVWTSGDREVALKMVFMYAFNTKKRGWMDEVRLLVWGPSGKLLTEDEELQKGLAGLKAEGVELYACKGCADLYGISEKLTALGINVMYTGTMLADAQKDGDWHVLTF